jgi:hypothetical protein
MNYEKAFFHIYSFTFVFSLFTPGKINLGKFLVSDIFFCDRWFGSKIVTFLVCPGCVKAFNFLLKIFPVPPKSMKKIPAP